MRSTPINSIYTNYLVDSAAHETALFQAATRRAMNILQDEDEAQDFVLGVWQALPGLTITESFSAWLNVRLRWHSLRAFRRASQNKELAASYIDFPPDDDGEQIGNDDKLAILAFRHDSKVREAGLPDMDAILDPFIRQVANLLLVGHTQDEIADILCVKPATLRKRLQRFREQDTEIRMAA